MYAYVHGLALFGIQGYLVQVEIDIGNGLPCFELVGLPSSSVREAKERVRSAIKNSGFNFPIQRITSNLAPADLRKDGPAFDLCLAVGILCASGQVISRTLDGTALIGELSLDGSVRPVRGVLPMVSSAREHGIQRVVVPLPNAEEASLVKGIDIIPVTSLRETCLAIESVSPPLYHSASTSLSTLTHSAMDMSDVHGQIHVKRALEIAAAGSHNILLIGPPGSGKTMLAHRLPTILPSLPFQEALEVTKIYSAAGLLKETSALVTERPFRAPHHTISASGLIGGGSLPKPGEVSLSHGGVLFLDELPEFRKSVLEVLRQPLEDGEVTISRARYAVTYPTRFQLIGSLNPCPCGFFGTDANTPCTCTPLQIQKYRSKLSGPLLDRIDLQIEVPHISYSDMAGTSCEEKSSSIRQRVEKARKRQNKRFPDKTMPVNAWMTAGEVKTYCKLSSEGEKLLQQAFENLGLSARAYQRILKVARTIADLEGMEDIRPEHIAEAISYRVLDRKWRKNPN